MNARNIRHRSLELCVSAALSAYRNKWYDENGWQWKDEGLVYAIVEYLSSSEMTYEDWEYARRTGIDDIILCLNDAE